MKKLRLHTLILEKQREEDNYGKKKYNKNFASDNGSSF
jgi:hypothetical protein